MESPGCCAYLDYYCQNHEADKTNGFVQGFTVTKKNPQLSLTDMLWVEL